MKKIFTIALLWISILGFSQSTPQVFNRPAKFTAVAELTTLDSIYGVDGEGIMRWVKKSDLIPAFVNDTVTLEKARQNGNLVEGDIEFKDYTRIFANSDIEEGIVSSILFDDGNFFLRQANTNPGGFRADLYINGQTTGASIEVFINDPTTIGILGNELYDKQDNPNAFAQIGDFDSITLEKARQNGNLVEGDIEFKDNTKISANSSIDEGVVSSISFDDGNLILQQADTNPGGFRSGLNIYGSLDGAGMYVDITDPTTIGILGNELYDKQGNPYAFAQIGDLQNGYVPFTGTPENKPITGSLETTSANAVVRKSGNVHFGVGSLDLVNADYRAEFDAYSDGDSTSVSIIRSSSVHGIASITFSSDEVNPSKIEVAGSPNFKGIEYDVDYSSNYTDRSIPDVEYVNKSVSYSTVESKTGGKWINEKPLYTKTFVFESEDLPNDTLLDMELLLEDVEDVATESFTITYLGKKFNGCNILVDRYLIYNITDNIITMQGGGTMNMDELDQLIYSIVYTKTTD